MLEYAPDYSVGRGTDAPFEQIGAPWIDGRELAAFLNRRFVRGVRFYPTRFRPASSACAGLEVQGVRFLVTDRESFSSERLGLEIASALLRLYPGRIALEANRRLIGSDPVMADLAAGRDPERIRQSDQDRLSDFLRLREKSLIYR